MIPKDLAGPRRVRVRARAFLALLLLLTSLPAWAHPLDESRSDITVAGSSLDWRLSVHSVFLSNLDSNGNGIVEPAEIDANAPVLQGYFARRLLVNADGDLCRPVITGINAPPGLPRALITLEYRCPAPITKLRIEMHLFDGVAANWVSLARLTWGRDVKEFSAFREGAGSWKVTGAPSTGLLAQFVLRSFLALGVEHIFTGYDHLLFLVGLLLLGRPRLVLFKIVTAFTVAHSITLILAALGVVHVSSHLVEPAIALSIAYVGAENFFLKSTDRRWIIAFAFGLIYGFGFASILREMGLPQRGLVLSLLSFNGGVELGQMAVVAVALPATLLIRRQSWQRYVVNAASLAIAGMGIYWFVERVTG